MPIDMSRVNLDEPLFPSREGGEGTTTPESTPESGQPTEPIENAQPTDGGQPSVPEQNVPYSRFKDAIEARREAERRADEAEAREAEARQERAERRTSESQGSSGPYDGNLPSWWLQMYGDNDTSRKAYAYEVERQEFIREEARREAREAYRDEQVQETRAISSNVNAIDERLEDLSLNLGRALTPQEEEALLDVVDEYTPTDDSGKYAGELISFDKAWEIMQMRQAQSGQRSSSARRVPTAITSTRSQGETTVTTKAEADKSWNPRDWNSWRKRIPGQ